MAQMALSLALKPSAAADPGAGRGVVTGKYFNLNPLPPAHDVLGNPLVVQNLPAHKWPKETWSSRLQRMLARFNLGSQSSGTRLRWKLQDTIASVMASVSPAITLSAEKRAQVKRNGQSVTMIVVRHPYHLRHAMDLITQVPDNLMQERRFLELILNRVLRQYGEQMSAIKGSPFAFEHEAREYFFTGFRLEKQIKKITNPDERFGVLQSIYTAYFHGRNYYYYALLRREKLTPENKLFMLFSRACYFMARIDWSGELLDKPNPKSLPSRNVILFHVQRDKSVLSRYTSDPDFQRQVKIVIEAFPE